MPGATIESPWRVELDDLLRGVAGAFLFGSPFLYTMEVWWKGNVASPPRMLLLLGVAYLALVLLDIQGGFRSEQPRSWARVFADGVEALAIALLTATFSLLLIRLINFDTGLGAVLGRVITLALPFSVGIGIANHVLLKRNEEDGGDEGDSSAHQWHDHAWRGTLADAGATVLGAVIIASSIAPTDEIPMIAGALTPPWLLGIIAASLVLSYIIVFEACFGAQQKRRSQPGILQSPVSETLASYILSLLISLAMLWVFQLLRAEDPFSQWVSYTVVLGLPATIGGAAGRLAL